MKILLTGVLPWSVWMISERLTRGGHDVTVLGQAEKQDSPLKGVHHVKMNLMNHEKDTARYISAGGFDVVLFFFACQCEDRRAYNGVQGRELDLMFNILHGASETSVNHFILVTDQRVFGEDQNASEDELPLPNSPTGIMLQAAESCVNCGISGKIRTLIVRTTSLYAPGDPDSFFSYAVQCAKSGEAMVLNGSEQTPCDFLHAEDFGTFLEHAVSLELEGIIHAPQGVPSTYGETVQGMKAFLPDLHVVYLPQARCRRALNGKRASATGWVPRHDFRGELEVLCAASESGQTARGKRWHKPDKLGWTVLKWAEVISLVFLAGWLMQEGEKNALLVSIDYMLLYVISMGFVHGRTAGMTASVLACIWYCWSFIQEGNAATDLMFNTDHWLPMSIYILCGSLFGYAQDRQRLKMELLEKEREEIARERDFVEGIYQSTFEDRNQLKEQIYHYRDSYGRIYQITRELDSLQPVQVYLSTLHVLESTLSNHSVAIYSCNPESSYIRLIVRSREMHDLPKSVDMNQFAPMYERLKEGKLFANHTLLSGYPVYALPVMSGNEMMAILMLWQVSFEQQSMYLENLLTVMAGLVQSALVRALTYHRHVADLYFENTHILTPAAFRETLGVYQSIRQQHTGSHVLVALKMNRELSLEVMDKYIGRLLRSTDVVGMLDDGQYYVLLPQATTDRIPAIDARFNSYGIHCEVVAEDIAIA